MSVAPSLAGLAPFQMGFVVRDLERAVRQGRPAEWTLRLVLNDRSPQYELIEPGEGPSIHADWLAKRGEGFHHVAYVVPSLDHVTTEMEAAGHPVVARIHSFGVDGDGAAAYFDTVDSLGFFVEAVEPPHRMPPIDFSF